MILFFNKQHNITAFSEINPLYIVYIIEVLPSVTYWYKIQLMNDMCVAIILQ